MKLTVFQSDKGDCLLLSSDDGKQVLVDGGMSTSYTQHVAPALGALREAGERLDLVYLSHIDQDHISGVLQLMEDHVAWRVHDFQRSSGNEEHRAPTVHRPPEIDELWHNGFRDQVGQNAGPIEEMLATTAAIYEGGPAAKQLEEALEQRQLATSVGEAIELSHRIGPEQLNIPLNRAFDGKLAMVGEQTPRIELGSLVITVLWPNQQRLDDLRKTWNDWLAKNEAAVERLRARMRSDAERLAAGEIEAFRAGIALQAGELGDMTQVTVPNLASLMVLVEEGGSTVLLTGDGHADHILEGLELAGKLDGNGGIHVDVLKVQHHGSEFNIRAQFCRRVTADHYVFCANGEHANPDRRAVELIIDSRLGSDSQRSPNPGAERPFKLSFNSSSAATPQEENKEHMGELERLVAARAERSEGRMTYSFLDDHSFELAL